MIDFGIKRLDMSDGGISRVYHLFGHDGSLKLVADFASPWLTSENPKRYVRFANSAGKIVAQMDLAATATKLFGGRQSKDYTIVLDHAVYAILSEFHSHEDDEERTYFVLRVAESMWLVLKEEKDPTQFTIHNDVPASFTSRSMEPMFSDLLEPSGEINRGSTQYDYAVSWHDERIKKMELLVLGLVFLIDRLEDG